MSARLKQIVSWWFILQIVLPFTAPLQTLDLRDLFGSHQQHRSYTSSPESTTTPTIAQADATTSIAALDSPESPHALVPARVIELPARLSVTRVSMSSSSPQVQQSVLRL